MTGPKAFHSIPMLCRFKGLRKGIARSRKVCMARRRTPHSVERARGTTSRGRRRGRISEDKVRAFVRSLAENERVALAVRDELYGGSWDRMKKDLGGRIAGRPYVFRLASRIEEDLKAVEKLRRFEKRYGVNLSDYLEEGR